MESSRSFLDRFYVCCNKIDGLYYLAARRLGVKENALSLLYTLDNGPPCSQKQLAEELLIPKTTINTIVKEYTDAATSLWSPAGTPGRKMSPSPPPGGPMPKRCSGPSIRRRSGPYPVLCGSTPRNL